MWHLLLHFQCGPLLLITLRVRWVYCTSQQILVSQHRILAVFFLHCLSGSLSLLLTDILLLRMRISPKLSLKGSSPSICTWLLVCLLDALSFMKFPNLHLLFSGCRILDCIGILLTLYFPHAWHHFGVCQLTSGLGNIDELQINVLLGDHLAKVRHSNIKILSKLLWLGPDKIDHCLQLSASSI